MSTTLVVLEIWDLLTKHWSFESQFYSTEYHHDVYHVSKSECLSFFECYASRHCGPPLSIYKSTSGIQHLFDSSIFPRKSRMVSRRICSKTYNRKNETNCLHWAFNGWKPARNGYFMIVQVSNKIFHDCQLTSGKTWMYFFALFYKKDAQFYRKNEKIAI